jgi:TrmH family RNA methyltransferase
MLKITSLTNTTIKHIVKIRKDRKYRNEKKELLVVGKNVINELKNKNFSLIITTNKDLEKKEYNAKDYILVTDTIMKKITNLSSPEDVVGILDFPKEEKLLNQKKIIVIDKIKDPGNLGTLIRSALAFDYDAVIILKDSCDPFLDKTIRASKGSIFSIPIIFLEKENLKDFLLKNDFDVFLADMNGEDLKKIKPRDKFAIILSSEAKGIDSFFEKFSKKVKINILNIDSLNVAVAGSILMEKLRD